MSMTAWTNERIRGDLDNVRRLFGFPEAIYTDADVASLFQKYGPLTPAAGWALAPGAPRDIGGEVWQLNTAAALFMYQYKCAERGNAQILETIREAIHGLRLAATDPHVRLAAKLGPQFAQIQDTQGGWSDAMEAVIKTPSLIEGAAEYLARLEQYIKPGNAEQLPHQPAAGRAYTARQAFFYEVATAYTFGNKEAPARSTDPAAARRDGTRFQNFVAEAAAMFRTSKLPGVQDWFSENTGAADELGTLTFGSVGEMVRKEMESDSDWLDGLREYAGTDYTRRDGSRSINSPAAKAALAALEGEIAADRAKLKAPGMTEGERQKLSRAVAMKEIRARELGGA